MFDAVIFIQVRKSLLAYLELAGPIDSNKVSQMCFEKFVNFSWNNLLASSQILIVRMLWDSLRELLLFKSEQIWEIPRSAYFSRFEFLAENSPWKSVHLHYSSCPITKVIIESWFLFFISLQNWFPVTPIDLYLCGGSGPSSMFDCEFLTLPKDLFSKA